LPIAVFKQADGMAVATKFYGLDLAMGITDPMIATARTSGQQPEGISHQTRWDGSIQIRKSQVF
jgi:hypothetical protein